MTLSTDKKSSRSAGTDTKRYGIEKRSSETEAQGTAQLRNGEEKNRSFADSQKGDSVTVEVTEKYVNEKLVDRYISGIE